MYQAAYGELYSSLPHHPMMSRSSSPVERLAHARPSLRTLRPYLERATSFLEIGPGDCGVTIEAAKRPNIKQSYAVDVSEEQVDQFGWPENLRFVKFDGQHVPLPDGVCDLAFTNQVIEHLHPEDEAVHLSEVHRLLRPGGKYVCVVPNQLTGPHDVSQHFDRVATGFHLNETTNRHLATAMRAAGFFNVRCVLRIKDTVVEYPVGVTAALESALRRMRHDVAHVLGHLAPGQKLNLVNVTLVGVAR